MRRVYYIFLLLLILSGCGGKRFVRNNISCITPVANSESFYAIIEKDTVVGGKYSEYHTFVRIDTDGFIHVLANLDTSFSTFHATIITDSTILFGKYSDSTICLYHIPSAKQTILLKGKNIATISQDHKFLVTESYIGRARTFRSYELRDTELIGKGDLSVNSNLYFTFGDSGFYYVEGRSGEGQLRIVGPDLKTLYSISLSNFYIDYGSFMQDSVTNRMIYVSSAMGMNNFLNYIGSYHLVTGQIDTLFTGMSYISVLPLKLENHYLIEARTKSDMDEDRKKVRSRKNDYYHDEHAAPRGDWRVGNSKTQKIYLLGYKEYNPVLSSTGKTILFVEKKSEGFDLKIVKLDTVFTKM